MAWPEGAVIVVTAQGNTEEDYADPGLVTPARPATENGCVK
ncbi:MAG TPA: hypothetical protein VFP34_17700 [Microlunatus sp.]|nr:hypothetical protein [Microlunatus sp.]